MQKTAWFMAHRIREGLASVLTSMDQSRLTRPTTVVGKAMRLTNFPNALNDRGRYLGRSAVIGERDGATEKVAAEVVDVVNKQTSSAWTGDG